MAGLAWLVAAAVPVSYVPANFVSAWGAMAKFTVTREAVPAPPVMLVGLNGERRDIRTLQGKVVLINFWATWCTPCIKEMPGLAELQRTFGPDRFEVITVSVDKDGAPRVRAAMARHGIELYSYVDPDSFIMKVFDAPAVPTTMLIDHNGMVRGRMLGGARWGSDAARDLIARYLAEAGV
ncbi:TlpA family protein disulfide reductase [Zavarzinia sp. CC-PAN008]|uniref:TlpA family protein disulfide reductase n=1 Tax=Zavarzinia sp. CC-PAN008 TaxID=3243332 RepID=UPI003F74546B